MFTGSSSTMRMRAWSGSACGDCGGLGFDRFIMSVRSSWSNRVLLPWHGGGFADVDARRQLAQLFDGLGNLIDLAAFGQRLELLCRRREGVKAGGAARAL